MPKYIRERERGQVPGAFGVAKAREDWESRNPPRPSGAMSYCKDPLYLFIDEEYGYAQYLWVYPGTAKQLVDDWMACRTPWGRSDEFGERFFSGVLRSVHLQCDEGSRNRQWSQRKMELVDSETGEVIEGFHHYRDFDGQGHVHMEDDSRLLIDYYEVRGLDTPELTIHVLDALAALR